MLESRHRPDNGWTFPMRTVAQSWRLLLLAVVCAASGCDTGVATSDLYSSQVDADVVFAEDADSAIASLPFVESELLVQPYPGANPKALRLAVAHAPAPSRRRPHVEGQFPGRCGTD